MQVKIDYLTELIYSEKKKIRWAVEEFDLQFGGKTTVFNQKEKKTAYQFINYLLNNIDFSEPEIMSFLNTQIQKLKNKYPDLLD